MRAIWLVLIFLKPKSDRSTQITCEQKYSMSLYPTVRKQNWVWLFCEFAVKFYVFFVVYNKLLIQTEKQTSGFSWRNHESVVSNDSSNVLTFFKEALKDTLWSHGLLYWVTKAYCIIDKNQQNKAVSLDCRNHEKPLWEIVNENFL